MQKYVSMRAVLGMAGLLSTASYAPIHAQPVQAAAGDAVGASGLEEIVVTARRRQENLQTVPVAVNALTGDTIASHHIEDASDLSKLVPAITTTQTTRDEESLTIRGLSNAGAAAQGQEFSVASYFAEIPLPVGDGGGPGRYFDLDNIQVLKGPQGTLFGRNSTGGAVLYEPKRPVDRFEGYAAAQFGNYNDREFEGALNVPLIAEKLLLRASFKQATRDGFTKNVLTGQDLDNRDYWAGRVSLIFRPTDDLENYFVFDHLYSHNNGSSEIIQGFNPDFVLKQNIFAGTAGASFFPPLPLTLGGNGPSVVLLKTNPIAAITQGLAAGRISFFPGPVLGQQVALQGALGPRAVASNVNGIDKTVSWGISDITKWEIADELTLKNIMGLRVYKQLIRADDDGTALPILGYVTPGGYNAQTRQFSEELQLQGKSFGDRLDWTVGGLVLFGHAGEFVQHITQEFGLNYLDSNNPLERSRALYAQATYDLSDLVEGLRFTGGYRYTWDYRWFGGIGFTSSGACTFLGATQPTCQSSQGARFKAGAWTVGLDYRITPEAFAYVTARRGYRSGGVDGQASSIDLSVYRPEFLTDVEIGLKADWTILGMKARTNIDAFHGDYSNAQVNEIDVVNGTTFNDIVNAASATVEGVELEGTLIPVKGVELTGAWAFTEATYDQFLNVATGQMDKGQRFPHAPQNKFTLTGRYYLPVDARLGEISLAASWAYSSHQVAISTPDPFATQGSFSVFDLRLDWTNVGGEPLDLSLFATNVTDTVYKIGGFPVYDAVGFSSAIYGEPRMYGVRLKYRFGED